MLIISEALVSHTTILWQVWQNDANLSNAFFVEYENMTYHTQPTTAQSNERFLYTLSVIHILLMYIHSSNIVFNVSSFTCFQYILVDKHAHYRWPLFDVLKCHSDGTDFESGNTCLCNKISGALISITGRGLHIALASLIKHIALLYHLKPSALPIICTAVW